MPRNRAATNRNRLERLVKVVDNALMGNNIELEMQVMLGSHDWDYATQQVRGYVTAYFDMKFKVLKSEEGRQGAPLGSFEFYEVTA